MPPPDPEHLFQHADALAAGPEVRQTDLRRAISAAYYGVFHFTLTAAADMVVGSGSRSSAQYSLVYRSVDHWRLRALCSQLGATRPQNFPLQPPNGFGSIAEYARIAAYLYELRSIADYDPSRTFTTHEAILAVSEARQAISWFRGAAAEQQQAFLMLLLFTPGRSSRCARCAASASDKR